jgi:hypothetical protein
MADDTTTSASYRLWTGRTGDKAVVITGDDLRFDGTLGRGYLTRPPIVCRRDGGEVAFQFGGNRRVAPSRHVLEAAGETLAVFETKLVSGLIDNRSRVITDSHGKELATVTPAEPARSRLRQLRSGSSYHVTVGGKRIGTVTRRDEAPSTPPEPGLRHRLSLIGTIGLDARLAAAILIYVRAVLDPARSPT